MLQDVAFFYSLKIHWRKLKNRKETSSEKQFVMNNSLSESHLEFSSNCNSEEENNEESDMKVTEVRNIVDSVIVR